MSYNEIFGIIFIAFIAIIGFFINIRKSMKDEQKPMEELNNNIVELNANFKNMLESDKVRDNRIAKHGVELDDLQQKVSANSVKIDNTRIKCEANDIRINEMEKKIARNETAIDNLKERLK